MEITVGDRGRGKRVDLFITELLSGNGPKWARSLITRSITDHLIASGVTVNGKYVKKGVRLKLKDEIRINLDVLEKVLQNSDLNKGKGEVFPEKGKLNIVFEDKDFLVLNKPKGIVMHPGIGNTSGTLANFVVGYLTSKGEYDPTVKRGGVVHRLDKGVSGLVVFAKNRSSQLYLKKQFENRETLKIYRATVRKIRGTEFSERVGKLVSSKNVNAEIEKYLKNKRVDSGWTKIEGKMGRDRSNRLKMRFSTSGTSGKYSCLYIKPLSKTDFLILLKTGRMHQIRATLSYLGFSILGDILYGDSSSINSKDLELEAVVLGLTDLERKRRVWKLV